ncbi:MAG: lytic transglycosylase domain-containing protein [Muribaculaceae bacterium]|nr:lytic transglycosylase domain-containing protein [Muribaculaceae bacterium]
MACGVVTLCAVAHVSGRTSADDTAPTVGAQFEFQQVINPEVPSFMTFAGEKIDLDRVDMYEKLDRELTSMAYTHGNTLLTIKRANRYFPVIAPILKQNGLSEDMLYLACIESYLNPLAYSPAKAAGIWQFVPGTAKQYGLEVNDEVDERYDIEKETRAACRYMKKAYELYGNWESVAASYNGGTARVSKELEAQQAGSAFDLYLVEETRRYPFRMMAMKLIMENPSQYGFRLNADQLYQPIEYTTVTVDGPVEDWPTWASEHGITYATLKEHNPWIRAKQLTNKSGKSYTVKIPTKESLSRKHQKIKVYNPAWIK